MPAPRLGRLPLVVLLVALCASVGGFFLARGWVENSEQNALEDQAGSTSTLIGSFARQIEALLFAGSVVVDVTGGDPEVFETKIGERTEGTAISSATLLRRAPNGFLPVAEAGGTSLLLPGFTEADEQTLASVADSPGQIRFVKIGVIGDERVVGFATAGGESGDLVIYGESIIPSLEQLFFVRLPEGLQYALYAGSVSPDRLLQASTTELPIAGQTVTEELKLGSESAVLVVGGSSSLVGTLTEATPWLVLGGGIVVSLVLALVLELTRRRAAGIASQHALAEQNAHLREVDRLKDELVATVSHELRTPLTSILGYLELIREDGSELSEEHRTFLEVIDRNARRLLNLVSDLLLVARIDAGRLELDLGEVDLTSVVRECLVAQQPRADHAGVLLELTETPLPAIEGDRVRLVQLVDNLVSNAIKFTPSGGRVDVRLNAEAATVVLEVADTGMGIPAAEQDRLFERFFRTTTASERAVQGTGLGLTIAKAIVDAHEGSISVESAERVGTTFRVELPVERQIRDPEIAAAPAAIA
jgi:signal transduction histidine kinase